MKVMLIGGGGREHSIARHIAADPRVERLYALPGNAGIAAVADCVPIAATDLDGVTGFAERHGIDYAIVAPDDPLVMGLVDRLEALGIRCFGPTAAAARIEGSKVYAKQLMARHGIPTAPFACFEDYDAACAYVRERRRYPVVIKADGLALGKGVHIAADYEAACEALRACLTERIHGASGSAVVIEDWIGQPEQEISLLLFCDSEAVRAMPAAMDHKRAGDGDCGPNTGGMGVAIPNPLYTPQVEAEVMERIVRPIVRALAEEEAPFRGCLYCGLMLTERGPQVIEFNCRFGDPETQPILALLETPLLDAMEACTDGRLDAVDVRFSQDAACCVVLASEGYPGDYVKGRPIELGGADALPGVELYHAGTRLAEGATAEAPRYETSGGRVLHVVARAPRLEEAIARAYEAADRIQFEGAWCRRDIGAAALRIAQGSGHESRGGETP